MIRSWLVSPALLFLMVGAAAAQSEPDDGPASKDSYPANVAERPLILPGALVEGSAQLRTFTYTGEFGDLYDPFAWIYTDLRMRAGIGTTEIFAEADLIVGEPDEGFDVEFLDRVAAGARVAVRPDQAVELRAGLRQPTADNSSLQLDATYLVRRKTSNAVAIIAGGGLAYYRGIGENVGPDNTFYASLQGRVGAVVQMTPQLAGDFDLRLNVPVADDFEDFSPPTQTDVGGRFMYVTPKFDAFVGVRLLTGGQVGTRTFFVGLAARVP